MTRLIQIASTSLLLLALALAGTGCQTVQSVLDAAPRPTVKVEDVKVRSLTLRGIAMDFDMKVTNPLAAPLPVMQMNYQLASGGQLFLTGDKTMADVIPARSSQNVSLPINLDFQGLAAILGGIRAGSVVPYDATIEFWADAPALGPISIPVRKSGEIPVPAVPEISIASINLDSLSLQEAVATINVDVRNTNSFALDVMRLTSDISLGGARVANASLLDAVDLPAGASGRVTIPMRVSPISIGLAAFNMFSGDSAGYVMSGLFEVQTPFGPLTMPYDASGTTLLRR